jgi:integrase
MSRMGMTIQDVQALLDHKSPSTTLRYYADVRADELKNKIDKLYSENC